MILDKIYRHTKDNPVRQRDLSKIVGISLGMTNVILKKLVQKGWVIIRKINNRNIQYAVTPEGIEEITRRSYKFLKKTVRNVVYYKDVLEAFLLRVKAQDIKGIVLVGASDFDFILGHLCLKHKLEFAQSQSDEPVDADGRLFIFSEDYEYSPVISGRYKEVRAAYLHDILIGL